MSDFEFNWDNLPSICKADQDIEILLDDIFKLNIYPNKYSDSKYCDLFQLKDENNNIVIDTIADIRKFKTDIYNTLTNLHNNADKKDIAKVFKEVLKTDNNGLGEILIYLSGLWKLTIYDFESNHVLWNSFSSRVKLSELNNYFIELSRTDLHTSFTIHTGKHCYIEPIVFSPEISEITFDSQNSDDPTHFSKIKFRDIELLPCEINQNSIEWWDDEKQSFNLESFTLKTDDKGNISTVGSDFENFQMKVSNTDKSVKLKSNSCYLLLKGSISKLNIYECNFTKLDFQNCEFTNIPNFDDKTSIKHSVDIDKATFDNLRNIKEAGSLEFSRLAEFFNRNSAYIEAQQLHRHYLLAKAKESKSKGLKIWVGLYDLINGCGTSLWKPFIGILYCWLFTYLIFLSSSIKLVMSVKSTGVIVYSSYSVLFSIKQALLVTVPLLATIHKPEIEMLDNGLLQIFVYFLMIVSYLLVFLMALQIRKLLKLKD